MSYKPEMLRWHYIEEERGQVRVDGVHVSPFVARILRHIALDRVQTPVGEWVLA